MVESRLETQSQNKLVHHKALSLLRLRRQRHSIWLITLCLLKHQNVTSILSYTFFGDLELESSIIILLGVSDNFLELEK